MLRIRTMTAADIPLGMRLKSQNGWNQLEADWQRLLAMEPGGGFVAEWNGAGVGTAGMCVFGPVAWVAMVLVEAEHRQRGIGTALMEHVLAFLDGRKVRSVRLDATPLGQPIYERLGFRTEYQLSRFEGKLPAAPRSTGVEPARTDLLPEICALDQRICATDRRKLLHRLYAERPDRMRVVRRDDRVIGFLTARPGARAWQVGPCIADVDAGPLLLADVWGRLTGEAVFLDIPLANRPAVALAERMGLTVQRHLHRMIRGEPVAESTTSLWMSSGPEKG